MRRVGFGGRGKSSYSAEQGLLGAVVSEHFCLRELRSDMLSALLASFVAIDYYN